jgi:4-azaleucine resistance transporter AzlC
MKNSSLIKQAFSMAVPIMVGYLFLGVPCGILSQSVGLDALQVFLLSIIFYSGAGQFMIPNMWLIGSPMAAILASVTLVNSRQMLYSASLSRFCDQASKPLTFLFGATVTDESFAVNVVKLEQNKWNIKGATIVNLFSQGSWALANVLGVLLGNMFSVPTALASFAMTSIFLCLLFSQPSTKSNIAAAVVAVFGVYLAKCIGLSGPAILIGALLGVVAGMIVVRKERVSGFGLD